MNEECVRSLCQKENLGEFLDHVPVGQFKGYYLDCFDNRYWSIHFRRGNTTWTVVSKIPTEGKAYKIMLECLRLQQHVIFHLDKIRACKL